MADRIVRLVDKNGDHLYPVSARAWGDYSYLERSTGVNWPFGQPIYAKTVSKTGITPGGNHAVSHGIVNLGQVIYITGMLKTSDGAFYMLPRASSGGSAQNVEVFVDSTNVYFKTGSDANFKSATVTIYYTKTS